MTVIPAKHTFTIWQGATFFEVLTLYETLDKTSPRDFCRQNDPADSLSGITVTTSTAGTTSATLNGSTTGLYVDSTYSISSSTIPATNNISFLTHGGPFTAPFAVTLSSGAGVTVGTGVSATITRRVLGYYAEMKIRNKPQGTVLHTLRTENHPDFDVENDSIINFPVDPATKGQIQLNIDKDTTANFGTSSSWKTGVYDLTITNSSTGVTDALLYGGIKVNGV